MLLLVEELVGIVDVEDDVVVANDEVLVVVEVRVTA